MVTLFLPGSFTKNFSWGKDPQRLHRSIRNGFGNTSQPVTRDAWREQSGLNDPNIELIPLNFFLYSRQGISDDYVLADTLVEFALTRAYDEQFAKLAVFAFHLASSGNWHGSERWPDGNLAGWANYLIKELAWRDNDWMASAFQKQTLLIFIRAHVIGQNDTQRKIRNNYWFMLQHASILHNEQLEPMNFNSQWAIAAPQLFWDRKIFDGSLFPSSNQSDFEQLFVDQQIYKLMRCSETQGRAMAKAAYRDYSSGRMNSRFEQIDGLKSLLAVAA